MPNSAVDIGFFADITAKDIHEACVARKTLLNIGFLADLTSEEIHNLDQQRLNAEHENCVECPNPGYRLLNINLMREERHYKPFNFRILSATMKDCCKNCEYR